jgi:hypothetical protein
MSAYGRNADMTQAWQAAIPTAQTNVRFQGVKRHRSLRPKLVAFLSA